MKGQRNATECHSWVNMHQAQAGMISQEKQWSNRLVGGMLEIALHPCTASGHNSEKYLNHKAVSCLNDPSLIFFNYLATPGPGTYVAPSAFGYYLSD